MCKKESKVKITESFKNSDINKRREALEKLICRIIKNREESLNK